jgi:hypothetical protein
MPRAVRGEHQFLCYIQSTYFDLKYAHNNLKILKIVLINFYCFK